MSYDKVLERTVQALFSAGQQGVIFDPSDFSTMFQDNLGTTQVTAVGQTDGLLLDKSNGMVLGPELVGNGTFTTDTSGWVPTGATIAVVAGEAQLTSTASGLMQANYTITCVVGQMYKVTGTFRTGTPGLAVYLGINGIYASVTASLTDVPASFIFTATGATQLVQAYASGTAIGNTMYFDNVSVKAISGNHATEATSTARPTLGRHPISGVRNLLTYTEDFSNAVWATITSGGGTASKTPNFGLAPNGLQEACRVQLAISVGTDLAYFYTPKSETGTAVGSFWLKTNDGTTKTVNFAGYGPHNITVTPTWTQFSGSQVSGANLGVILGNSTGTDTSADLLFWHPQLELGSTTTNYQKVVSQFDITEAGFNSVYELTGDGVDDVLSVVSGGGGTTGILLCAAIKPAATAAATLWSDAGTNTGYKLTLNSTNNIILSAGNGTAYTSVTGPVIPAGTEDIVEAWHDNVNLNIRVNGGAITSTPFATAAAGTAGFNILADNGTPANFFNGTIAGLVYRQNDASTLTDRANVRAYLNSKAGAF